MSAPRLLTLPELAKAIDVQYRTLHSWLVRGLIRPSLQASRGTGVPNLFTFDDAVRAKVIADLRRWGVSFERVLEAARELDDHPEALDTGAMVLVNGAVSVVDAKGAAAALERESLTLVYNTAHAVRDIGSVLVGA